MALVPSGSMTIMSVRPVGVLLSMVSVADSWLLPMGVMALTVIPGTMEVERVKRMASPILKPDPVRMIVKVVPRAPDEGVAAVILKGGRISNDAVVRWSSKSDAEPLLRTSRVIW